MIHDSPSEPDPAFGAADILWREDGSPFSPHYGDGYFSHAGGVAEKRAVFVEGCGLPERFAMGRDVSVLELGFGTGLGFLVTAAAFLSAAPSGASRLWFYSIEKHPWRKADFTRFVAQWPEFSGLATDLAEQWPDIVPGFHRRYLAGGRIVLTLLYGEALTMLESLGAARFEAIYLDGFSPARNQAMWSSRLCAALRQRALPGARISTYSAARAVADALRSAGFVVQKVPGFAGKRHRLVAVAPGEPIDAPDPCAPDSAVVVGAGIAGLSAAYALAKRGVSVTVFESAMPSAGASGNPAGLLTPLLTVDHNRPSQLVQMGLGFSRAQIAQLQAEDRPITAAFTGAIQVVRDLEYAARQQRLLAQNPPDESLAVARSVEALSQQTGLPHPLPGWWYPGAGWVVPIDWLAAMAGEPALRLCPGKPVAAIHWAPMTNRWWGEDATGVRCFDTSTLIVATGAAVSSLLPALAGAVFPCRGQVNISRFSGSCQPIPLMREGYLVDLPDGRRVYGASFKPRVTDTRPRAEETLENRQRLAEISPALSDGMPDAAADQARVSLRATTRDRLPLVGAYRPEGAGALWLSVGHGSRGLTTAPLCGEHLTALILGERPVLPQAIADALAPSSRIK